MPGSSSRNPRCKRSKASALVFVRNDHGFEARKVSTGREDDRAVEIVSGLSAGEDIAVSQHLRAQGRARQGEAEHCTEARMIGRILDFLRSPALAGRRPAASRRAARRVVAHAAADRRRARHHQQSGADQHRRAGALAGRDREAGHVSDRDRARRHPGPRIHPLAVAQRLLAGHGRLQRQHRHLLRPPAGQRAARRGHGRACRRAPSPRWGRSRPASARSTCGPSSIGRPREGVPVRDGAAGLAERRQLPHARGQRLTNELERAAYLRTVQDWIIRPQLKGVPGVAGVDAIGGYVKQYHVQPDPTKLIGLRAFLRATSPRRSSATTSAGAPATIEQQRRGLRRPRQRPGREHGRDRRRSSSRRAAAIPVRVKTSPRSTIGRELRTGSASENGEEVVVGTALMLIGAEQPHRRRGGRRQDRGDRPHPAARHPGANGAQPHEARRRHHRDGRDRTSPRARSSSSSCCSCCSATSAPRSSPRW